MLEAFSCGTWSWDLNLLDIYIIGSQPISWRFPQNKMAGWSTLLRNITNRNHKNLKYNNLLFTSNYLLCVLLDLKYNNPIRLSVEAHIPHFSHSLRCFRMQYKEEGHLSPSHTTQISLISPPHNSQEEISLISLHLTLRSHDRLAEISLISPVSSHHLTFTAQQSAALKNLTSSSLTRLVVCYP